MTLAVLLVAAALAAHPSFGAEEPSCAAWATLAPKDRLIVIGSSLEQRFGGPESSKLAACLWSIYDQIADHTTELCARDGGAYSSAARHALDSAIDFCARR